MCIRDSLHPLNLAIGLARLADAAGARIRELSHVHHIRHGSRAGYLDDGSGTARNDSDAVAPRVTAPPRDSLSRAWSAG